MARRKGAARVARELGWKLDPQLKAKWVAALESGNYTQIQTALHTDNGFCCLGVLCDVVKPNAWKPKLKFMERYLWDKFPEAGYPPPGLIPRDVAMALVEYNDKDGWDFEHIARYIKRYL